MQIGSSGEPQEATVTLGCASSILAFVVSSKRSINWDGARKTASKKNRGETWPEKAKRTPAGKLNKRSFRPLMDCLQGPVT